MLEMESNPIGAPPLGTPAEQSRPTSYTHTAVYTEYRQYALAQLYTSTLTPPPPPPHTHTPTHPYL